MSAEVSASALLEIASMLAETLGWSYPVDRLPDLLRGLELTAQELDLPVEELAEQLQDRPMTREQADALSRHLTVGETYFWREPQTLDAFRDEVLPRLVRETPPDRPLLFWSAGCASGEEAYTLAILLLEHLPPPALRRATIYATDINPVFLERARTGIYGAWSFRKVPPWLPQRYFTRLPDDQYRVNNRVRNLVRFSRLNLADTLFPPPLSGPGTLAAIFCRNVLIYFNVFQVSLLLQRFHRTLADGGWLLVSPSEIPLASTGPFQRVWRPEVTLFRKSTHSPEETTPVFAPRPHHPKLPAPPALPRTPSPAAPLPALNLPRPPSPTAPDVEAERAAALQTARREANQGHHREALKYLDKVLGGHRLDAEIHYLRATIAWEAGETVEAQNSLRRAIFLEPDFILAHYLMANLAKTTGNMIEAERHWAITHDLLEHFDPEAEVPYSEGLSASQLKNLLTGLENAQNG
jgi:chemotaxis protein methyltransferase CheR